MTATTDSSGPTDGRDKSPEPRRLPATVRVLGWVSLVNDAASEAIYPLLPTFIMHTLGGNKLQLGLIEGVAESAASLLKLASGAWSDRLPRRKGLIVFGYLLAALCRPLIGAAHSVWQVLAIRGTDRVGKGIRGAPRDAMIADVTAAEERGRAFGFHRAMDHLGSAIGPLLATAFLLWRPGDLRTLFLLTIVPGLIVVLLLVLGLRAPGVHEHQEPTGDDAHEPLGRNFAWYLAVLCLFTLGNSSDAFLLVRAEELGVHVAYLPLLWLMFSLLKAVGNLAVGGAVHRLGPLRLIQVGWLCYAAVYMGFAGATQYYEAWLLFAAYAVFFALTEPAEKTLVANLVPAHRRGLAYGWFNLALGIAALPSSLLFGWLYDRYGALGAFGFGAGLALLASLLLGFVREPRRLPT